jgi:polyhydroxyalkanoate synthase
MTDTTTDRPARDLTAATLEAMLRAVPGPGLGPEELTSAAEAAVKRPAGLFSRMLRMSAEQVRIAAGLSDVGPEPRDRRFNDEAFSTNPVLRRWAQSYLLWNREVHELLDDLDLDAESRLRTEFFVNLVTEAVAPTNSLLGNPAALRRAVETRGKSLLRGVRNAADDLAHNNGMPSTVNREPFVVGENTAATPGAVVLRTPMFELIRYAPTTDQVHQHPILITPPQINKYYILDMAPGRSLAEHATAHGHQVFMISWRNPGPDHRAWALDDYANSVIEATDAALEITGADKVNLLGVCAGGMTNSTVLGHLAAIADERIQSASFLVSVIDWSEPSTLGSLLTEPAVDALRSRSDSAGLLEGSDLATIFALLRPNDLVWNYWVNNYLMGDQPAAFDVLAWNSDVTNLPAGLHNDFLDIAAGNTLTEPGATEVLGTPIDLGRVHCPSFVVGAVTDHITPWKGCYRTVNLLGGPSEFVLSSQGHVQALVNPSGNPKGSYQLNPATPDDPDAWLADATTHKGSWWDYWMTWLEPHRGDLVDRPVDLGSTAHPVLDAAPGTYVVEPRPQATEPARR